MKLPKSLSEDLREAADMISDMLDGGDESYKRDKALIARLRKVADMLEKDAAKCD